MTSKRLFSRILIFLYVLSVAIIVAAFIRGFDYYLTPLASRPHHPDYRLLRPAGAWGLWYGILGAAMMIAMLSYTLRKRTRLMGKAGRLKTWLDLHIFFGIVGPLLVVMHTSFKLDGLVAVSFWSMVAVALSGVFGRYLYVQIPRNIMGDAYTAEELTKNLRAESTTLEQQLNAEQIDWLVSLMLGPHPPSHQIPFIFWMIRERITRSGRTKRARLLLKQQGYSELDQRDIMVKAHTYATLKRRAASLRTVLSLFHHWHVFHRPFATVMYTIMLIHIGIALAFGIAWKA
ncbi:MAG: hypothetical protein KDC35_12075 [Acidobacteria bacterium]|nr:hypothetical protein [Acidobacteriota bacterium]